MSLLDMMNFSLHGFVWALRLLSWEIHTATQRNVQDQISNEDKIRIESNMRIVVEQCNRLNLGNTRDRQERAYLALRGPASCTYGRIMLELKTLREAIEDDIKKEYFYHYPLQKAQMAIQNGQWILAFKAFSLAKPEAEAGLDCYALDHNPACVFHMMRVAEIGMRALARERQVTFPKHPLEWAEWENIIDQIDSKAKAETNGMPRGPARDAARGFYTAAVAQLRAFKETRNRIMHMRGSFDELDAQRAINQVRDFMNGLSAKIGEKTRRPIRKWP